jgi:hypothetical protein
VVVVTACTSAAQGGPGTHPHHSHITRRPRPVRAASAAPRRPLARLPGCDQQRETRGGRPAPSQAARLTSAAAFARQTASMISHSSVELIRSAFEVKHGGPADHVVAESTASRPRRNTDRATSWHAGHPSIPPPPCFDPTAQDLDHSVGPAGRPYALSQLGLGPSDPSPAPFPPRPARCKPIGTARPSSRFVKVGGSDTRSRYGMLYFATGTRSDSANIPGEDPASWAPPYGSALREGLLERPRTGGADPAGPLVWTI